MVMKTTNYNGNLEQYITTIQENLPVVVHLAPDLALAAVWVNSGFVDRNGNVHVISYQSNKEIIPLEQGVGGIDNLVDDVSNACESIVTAVESYGGLYGETSWSDDTDREKQEFQPDNHYDFLQRAVAYFQPDSVVGSYEEKNGLVVIEKKGYQLIIRVPEMNITRVKEIVPAFEMIDYETLTERLFDY